MVEVTGYQYDGGNGGGDGLLTATTAVRRFDRHR